MVPKAEAKQRVDVSICYPIEVTLRTYISYSYCCVKNYSKMSRFKTTIIYLAHGFVGPSVWASSAALCQACSCACGQLVGSAGRLVGLAGEVPRLVWLISVSHSQESSYKLQQERKAPGTRDFQASACITIGNVYLTKASYRDKGWSERLHSMSSWKDPVTLQGYRCKGRA